MKPKILYIAATFLTANLAFSQVLYTENFDNLAVGSLGTDVTGQTPGQGGWYTNSRISINAGTNNIANSDFRIVPETGRGNVLIVDGFANDASLSSPSMTRFVYRTDIDTHWNQRTAGSDIFKFSFDFYTGAASPAVSTFLYEQMALYSKHGMYLCNFYFDERSRRLGFQIAGFPHSGGPSPGGTIPNYRPPVLLPEHSWVTLEVFIDYTAQKFYVSIPSFNLTTSVDFAFPMALEDPVNEADPVNGTPGKVQFSFTNWNKNFFHSVKYDNINISAINTAPALSINAFISEKFNLFPNPAADAVTITNSENLGIEEIAVYDLTGRVIKTKDYNNENSVQLNLSDLATATYLLHIKTNKGTAVKKLVKN